MVIINDTLGTYGGSQTLILRMCQWLSQKGIRTAVFCQSDANGEVVQKLQSCGTQIICLDIRDIQAVKATFQNLKADGEELRIFNFMWNYYLDMERFKQVTGLKFSNVIYAIHPGTFRKGVAVQIPIIREMLQRNTAELLERANRNRSVYFMDEDVLDATRSYLNTALKPEPPRFFIPTFFAEREDAGVIIEAGYRNQLILTASRAEYPFKGYLLGMVEDYRMLKEQYPDLRLEMVVGGLEEDVAVLKRKLAELPEEFQRDVIFHDWMDYDALKKEMEKCKLFVGMGTSILDAAQAYKPAIPVRHSVYQALADSLLSDQPQMLCAEQNCQTSARPLIERVLEMSLEEYCESCFSSYRQAERFYNIDRIMEGMLQEKPLRQDCLLSRREGMLHHLYNCVRTLFRREKDSFSIKSIKRE